MAGEGEGREGGEEDSVEGGGDKRVVDAEMAMLVLLVWVAKR